MKKMSKAKIALIVCATILFIFLLYCIITYFMQPNGLELIRSNYFEIVSCLTGSFILTYIISQID